MRWRWGCPGEDPRRVEAGILFELRHNLGNGHTFLPAEKLVDATVALLELDRDTVQIALEQLAQTQRVYLEPLRNLTACYLPELYEAETYVQARLPTDVCHAAGQAPRTWNICWTRQNGRRAWSMPSASGRPLRWRR